MNLTGIPKFVWGLVGAAVLVLGFLLWLHLHDVRVREGAAAHATISAKDDTIATLAKEVASLTVAAQRADSAYAAATAAVVRVAVVPRALRDSLLALNHALDSLEAHGGAMVPIAIAQQLRGQLNACTKERDTIAAAVAGLARDCEKRVAARDSVIRADQNIQRLMRDKLAASQKMAGLSTPRFTPFAGANYSLARKKVDVEAGVMLRILSGLHATASARFRDSLDVVVGGRYEFR